MAVLDRARDDFRRWIEANPRRVVDMAGDSVPAVYPDYTVSKFAEALVFIPATTERMAANLRKTGLPD